MTITESRNENTIQLSVEGRVDVTTSPALQNAILLAFQKGSRLVVDFAGVDYISSAGLRALLIGQKTASSKGASMVLTGIQEAVKSVLDMSGFSSILKIE